ncbi:UDP-N-acetylmuramoyl-L-alanyl-D-glutamate--2,6-diaminopimelate ligase [Kineococcus sp. R8]|uniref:UDP-N-acetylmuramoyl-L-alanyl-D-glutamate--2, 6-diaminopimelate ligase n=1 Tax=Kineococcus siccus TaxID=2696567 RepID=UPI001413285A|nr:UDP-N-acetylmuramoyl-L-alanyl-D-glutamate--2,6-diaminopimelate ligase [Kineococcus siccus]NAZ83039.1 UDP-N-acetylmuramoyl-L-alanyl-D-glutamate--2,6-diaminopimelate ligase [Kineococcus siccus]
MTDGPGGGSLRGHVSLADLSQALATPVRAAGDLEPDPGLPVTGATLDSRRVSPGDLYAALPGANAHGAAFAAQAAAAGAVVALTDPAGAERVAAAGLPALVVADPRAVLGDVAAAVHGHPGRALTTIGITGTNGKTTTAYLVESVLRGAGWTTGLLGTVETRVAGRRVPSVRTTPEAPDLHALLAHMVEAGVRGCALEVSSHALALHRVDGLVLDVAVFTNLSQDHLDFHGSLEEYFLAKASLFTPRHTRAGVVAVDTGWGRRLAAQAGVPVTTVRTEPEEGDVAGAVDADVAVVDVRAGRSGSTFRLVARRDGAAAHLLPAPLELTAALPGAFNVANAALAAVAALVAGLDAHAVRTGLEAATGVPGRMERVGTRSDEPLVVVDYAHSPDAVERVLQTLRPGTAGRLVVVLGAGGDRDRAKRPLMGEVAARLADLVVVTDDNPRSEDPALVRAAVLDGARGPAEVREVADRRAAVTAALAACTGPGDTVLLAGKGHESGQEVAGVTTPFDDREVAAEALAAWRAAHAPASREAPRSRPVSSSNAGAAAAPVQTPFGGRS